MSMQSLTFFAPKKDACYAEREQFALYSNFWNCKKYLLIANAPTEPRRRFEVCGAKKVCL